MRNTYKKIKRKKLKARIMNRGRAMKKKRKNKWRIKEGAATEVSEVRTRMLGMTYQKIENPYGGDKKQAKREK